MKEITITKKEFSDKVTTVDEEPKESEQVKEPKHDKEPEEALN